MLVTSAESFYSSSSLGSLPHPHRVGNRLETDISQLLSQGCTSDPHLRLSTPCRFEILVAFVVHV